MRRQQFRQAQTAVRSPRAPSDPLATLHSYDALINPSRPIRSSPLGSSTIAGLPLELLDRLKAFPLFQTAPDAFLQDIGKSLRPNVYQPNQEIIREGEEARAIYWLVRGSVKVTSRDGESTYAELKPGAFFGEIGILMNMPRTASITASSRSLVVRLSKEDLQKELPKYPEIERAIREEALERLSILERKKKELKPPTSLTNESFLGTNALRKRARDHWSLGDVEMGEAGSLASRESTAFKKRKSPSPGVNEMISLGAYGDNPLTVRQLLKSLPLFSGLSDEILHYLGVNAMPVMFVPFTEILSQGTTGRDVYFIVKGEVEVLTKSVNDILSGLRDHLQVRPVGYTRPEQPYRVRARLRAGQYFGEVTNLALAPTRTATVRSISATECLLISGSVLDELWRRCGAELRQQVEHEALRRMKAAQREDGGDDVVMGDDHTSASGPILRGFDTSRNDATFVEGWHSKIPPQLIEPTDSLHKVPQMEPIDPDPFFSAELDSVRSRSRRSSLAPPLVTDAPGSLLIEAQQRTPSPPAIRVHPAPPSKKRPSPSITSTSTGQVSPLQNRASLDRRSDQTSQGRLGDSILVRIFQYSSLVGLMHFRLVSMHWCKLLNSSPEILRNLDLSQHNRYVNDDSLRRSIIPFIKGRPVHVNMNNCFHVTDEGFKELAEACGKNVRTWKMRSVWDVSAPAILALTEKGSQLEEIDFSNCRKVGDNLLSRIIGWVVPESLSNHTPVAAPPQNGRRTGYKRGLVPQTIHAEPHGNHPGTIVGATKLKRLTLSYCKHVQDRSMVHIASHTSDHLEVLDLTRCTSISDAGFQCWGTHEFRTLRKLVLADCTYLTDQAIVGVVGGCRALQEIDLSFCCALSDTSTEVLALGLPLLRSLNMAFCGSAISDNSLRCIGLHLLELRYLSVRGCVRVTGHGVENIVEGCRHLEHFDVSQCKNLSHWLDEGGVERVNGYSNRERSISFQTVADGQWRVGPR